jgi:hypothetical protein
MNAIRILAVAALIGCCAGPAMAQAPAGTDTALAVGDYVKAEQSGGLGQNKRVAIASFVLQFVRDQGIERDAGSFGMFQGKSATYFVQVRGADPAVLQSIADKLYDNFVASLKAGGVEVVPQAELDANPQYQEIRKASPPAPQTESLEKGSGRDRHMAVNVLVTAKGLPLMLYGVDDKKWLPPTMSAVGSLQTVVLGGAQAAKALQAPLINVRTTVAMVEPKGKGSFSSSQFGNMVTKTSSWEFDADVTPRFVEAGSAVMVHGVVLNGLPSSHNVIRLVKPVAITGLELSSERGAGGSSARGSGLLGALGRAVGGTDAAADAYVDIEPANFSNSVVAGGTKVVDLFAKALTAP